MNLDEIVRCPRCKGPLVRREASYDCRACRVRYAVVDGVPRFIPSDATPLPDDDRGPT